jgi:hypothetical protein
MGDEDVLPVLIAILFLVERVERKEVVWLWRACYLDSRRDRWVSFCGVVSVEGMMEGWVGSVDLCVDEMWL